MRIEKILSTEKLSVRTYNICLENELLELSQLLTYYKENKSFKNLRKCGSKSDFELTNLCIKYVNTYNLLGSNESPEKQNSSFINLSRIQREIINTYIELNLNNLSNRSRNAIYSYLDGDYKVRNICEKVIDNHGFDIRDIKNIGEKSFAELKIFFISINELILKVSSINSENELLALRTRFILEKTFSISSIPDDILSSNSIFKVVDFLLIKNAIFEGKENFIFKKAFKIFSNKSEISLDEVAVQINISRERVRQIRKTLISNLFNSFKFIVNFSNNLYQKYEIDINQNLIIIESDLNEKINFINKTNFSIEFNTYLIFVYVSDSFDLIGEIEDLFLPKYFNSRERHNWSNFYLVNKKISNSIKLNDLADDLDCRIRERIDESYSFNFKSYLLNFLNYSCNHHEMYMIEEVSEKIVNKEFGIYIDTEDNINFNRNTVKQVYEYVYEALQVLGKPSKISEIAKKVKELNPTFEVNEAKVRSSTKRNNGFVPIGRSSTFGLKEWEDENFRGGTIRSIAYEYLDSFDEPQHISKVSEYVLNFRPNTYERSILDNLKADKTGTFIFFKNSTIGLKYKQYDSTFIEFNLLESVDIQSWNDRFNDFSKFLSVNNRLPFSSGCPVEEIRLYRWFKVQDRKIKSGKLDSKKIEMLNNLYYESQIYIDSNIKASKSLEKYIQLVDFVKLKYRYPSAHMQEEVSLYRFFYKQRKRFEMHLLNEQETNYFMEIVNVISNI